MGTGGGGPIHASLLQDTTLAELAAAWPERELEAACLAAAGYRSMAAAIRCYALEIRVKVAICRRLNLGQLPRACKTHDLRELIILTGLWEELNDPANTRVATNWYTVWEFNRRHLNGLRYNPASHLPVGDADDLDAALDDARDGVHAWLSRPR